MKKETLDEAAERLAYDSTEENRGFPSMKIFIEGAKWQAERMYSEEEVRRIASRAFLIKSNNETILEDFEQWFEQFKKK